MRVAAAQQTDLSLRQAAELLGLSTATFYRLCEESPAAPDTAVAQSSKIRRRRRPLSNRGKVRSWSAGSIPMPESGTDSRAQLPSPASETSTPRPAPLLRGRPLHRAFRERIW